VPSRGEPLEKYSEKGVYCYYSLHEDQQTDYSVSTFVCIGWDKVMTVNLKSVFYLTRALLPSLKAAASSSDPARIINIGSVVGFKPQLIPTYSCMAHPFSDYHQLMPPLHVMSCDVMMLVVTIR
jgi:NAD(P)-dependent dehydrogenase (short-subunit alcohol dehydrogenase family)